MHAEEMRQQRNEEAKQLIGNTFDKAKAIFNQNTATGQLVNKAARTAPVKPIRNSITRSTNSQRQQSPDQENSQQQPGKSIPLIDAQSTNNDLHINQNFVKENTFSNQTATNLEDDDSSSYSTIKRSPYSKSNSHDKQSDEFEPVRQSDIERSTEQQPSIVDPGESKDQMTLF